MKSVVLSILTLVVVLSSCSKSKPDTTPLHPSEPAVVPTTEDEMRHLVTAMTATNDWNKVFSPEMVSLMDEASHLTLAQRDSVPFQAFDWSCHTGNTDKEYSNNIESINITKDSVTIDMKHEGTSTVAYKLIMRHTKGRWCVDDIAWTGKEAPADTERHLTEAYIDEAINQLTSTDAGFIVENRILPLLDKCKQNPAIANKAIKDIETMHNYLKQNRGYSDLLEKKIQTTIKGIKEIK